MSWIPTATRDPQHGNEGDSEATTKSAHLTEVFWGCAGLPTIREARVDDGVSQRVDFTGHGVDRSRGLQVGSEEMSMRCAGKGGTLKGHTCRW
jgi:hypothetical protein